MTRSITLHLKSELLSAAKRRATAHDRTLAGYIEMLILRDLQGTPRLQVIAPPDITEYEAVPLPGETAAERRRRDALFQAILKAGNRPSRKR
jgi:hypothetical protein